MYSSSSKWQKNSPLHYVIHLFEAATSLLYTVTDFPWVTVGIGQWSLSFSFLFMLFEMMLSFLVCWYRMVAVAAERYQAGLERGMKLTDAWNASSCDWIAAAIVSNIIPCITFWRPLPTDLYCVHIITLLLQAHCHYIVLKAFHEAVQNSAMTTPSNIGIVNALCTLYATFGVMKYSGDFMMVCNAHVFVWEISK